jgi:wyosine [tRNA(Phe)-imidazoG37] synthetase (radical SAM superfamily)
VVPSFGSARDFLENRFVYLLISERAGGLSVGVNMNPDKRCDFDCLYCEVDRRHRSLQPVLEVEVMAAELQQTLLNIHDGTLASHPRYALLAPELRVLRHVTLSGDGEPTLCPQFKEAVEVVAHVRATGRVPFFKLVLLTNASGVHRDEVQAGLRMLTREDEVWVKLDGGTEDYLRRVNRTRLPLQQVMNNILMLATQRSVVIQSLFPAIDGAEPSAEEIRQYALRLKELKEAGAQISLVQVYSATRPIVHPECSHLPLKTLSRIAHTVRTLTRLDTEVF